MSETSTCEHTRLLKEYMGGMDTGDKICADCRQVFTPAEVAEMRR